MVNKKKGNAAITVPIEVQFIVTVYLISEVLPIWFVYQNSRWAARYNVAYTRGFRSVHNCIAYYDHESIHFHLQKRSFATGSNPATV